MDTRPPAEILAEVYAEIAARARAQEEHEERVRERRETWQAGLDARDRVIGDGVDDDMPAWSPPSRYEKKQIDEYIRTRFERGEARKAERARNAERREQAERFAEERSQALFDGWADKHGLPDPHHNKVPRD